MKLTEHDLKLIKKHRPKGYNIKVWKAMFLRAKRSKNWAFKTIQNQNWLSEASPASIVYLGEKLYLNEFDIAKKNYDYLKFRSHGRTITGHIDNHAKKVWEKISGRKISIQCTKK